MATLVAYLISIGIVAFGIWTLTVAAGSAPGYLLVWTLLSLLTVTVGLLSFFLEMRNHTTRRC
jgi:hypothetical protein